MPAFFLPAPQEKSGGLSGCFAIFKSHLTVYKDPGYPGGVVMWIGKG
jgi:hypothetical protein